MRRRAWRRAWRFEERLERGEGSEIARRCWEEIKERTVGTKELSKWEQERIEFYKKREIKIEKWGGDEEEKMGMA